MKIRGVLLCMCCVVFCNDTRIRIEPFGTRILVRYTYKPNDSWTNPIKFGK